MVQQNCAKPENWSKMNGCSSNHSISNNPKWKYEYKNILVNKDPLSDVLKDIEQSPTHDVLNDGEDDQMFITGYRRSKFKTFVTYLSFVLTAGFLRLIMHWRSHWLLMSTHDKCTLDSAEKILIHEFYEAAHSVYYVKDVILLNWKSYNEVCLNNNKSKKLSQNAKILKGKLKEEQFINVLDTASFQVAFHTESGIFEHKNSITFFCCKKLKYIWDVEKKKYIRLKGLDENVPSIVLHNSQGLSTIDQYMRRLIYGRNEIIIPIKDAFTLFCLEVSNPFYVFQLFSLCLWFAYNYYYYAVVILLMSSFGISMSIIQTKKNQASLKSTLQHHDNAILITDNSESTIVDTRLLVPGDVLEIPPTGCTMQCDAVLISGNAILDESMLTGESVPVTKTPLPLQKDLLFDSTEHARHTLFCGTKVIQTRYFGSEKVLVKVINTGYVTAKGELIRSILYPPPVDFKFEQDSYKFISLLGSIAAIGFVYTVVTKILRGIPATKIAIESLDLITIAVPPALPAAMAVGRMYAQKRLERNDIYCISPRSINVSGSINCVCFDKTGTLTEDGLDMWGVLPTNNFHLFDAPVHQIPNLEFDSHLLTGMVTCHSITVMDGKLRGDPLDLKMFESSGWLLEEANVTDETKYDLLFPTIVKPPKNSSFEKCDDVAILREFSFTSALQRMSVVTRKMSDHNFHAYCKGSPEIIFSLCRPETIPHDFHSKLEHFAQQGYRIISVAYKSLDRKIHYSKVQKLSRESVECDLNFLGFVIMENRLKEDTVEIIESLKKAAIRTIMITGDNLLTAASVAKDCGMIRMEQNIVSVNARMVNSDPEKYELYYNLVGQVMENELDGILDYSNANSNSITSFDTIESFTQLTHASGENSIIENDVKKIKKIQSSFTYAMTGKTYEVIKEYFHEQLGTFITKGTVFARMSPDQKRNLVVELQNVGYYVAMCGDGANDCGALKAAHTGISLSDAESSVASPFISKKTTIACVPNVIREGRTALVTSFGIFKYMAAYSLVQFASVLILYSIDSNLTDWEYLYIDLFLISVFAFFFGKTSSYEGPLDKHTPSNSLISMSPIMSLLLHLTVCIVFQVIGWFHIQNQSWFVPFAYDEVLDDNNLGCHQNYIIFGISCFQYIILATVFSKGAPYRKSIFSNYGFLFSILINICFTIYLILYPAPFLIRNFNLVLPDSFTFRLYLIGYGFLNFVICVFIEVYVIDYLVFKHLKHVFPNKNTSKKYKIIEKEFTPGSRFWPVISTPSSTQKEGLYKRPSLEKKKSPIVFTKISNEETTFNDNAGVLKNFFATSGFSTIENEKTNVLIG